MKPIKLLLTVGAVAVGAAVSYQVFLSSTLPMRVGEHEERISELTKRSDEQVETLNEQGKKIAETGVQVDDHEKRINELFEALEKAEARLREAMARGKANESEIGSLRGEITKLAKEHALLVQDYEKRKEQVRLLSERMDEQARFNAEFERRLRALEKESAVPSP